MNETYAVYRTGALGAAQPLGTVAAPGLIAGTCLATTMWSGPLVLVPVLGLTVAEATADEQDRNAAGELRIMRAIRKAAA